VNFYLTTSTTFDAKPYRVLRTALPVPKFMSHQRPIWHQALDGSFPAKCRSEEIYLQQVEDPRLHFELNPLPVLLGRKR